MVVPGIPHHVTQRGNRRQRTFFQESDYQAYLALMAEWCTRHDVEVWGYCLMPNHIHLIAVPHEEVSLRQAIGEAHRRYSRHVNFREGWRGHLWQGRFASFPMDERYLLAAIRYVELNPVRANLVRNAEDYPWSSARAHISGADDVLVKTTPLLDLVGDWRRFIATDGTSGEMEKLRKHERTGRPLGDDHFIDRMECALNRGLRKKKPGPKPKKK